MCKCVDWKCLLQHKYLSFYCSLCAVFNCLVFLFLLQTFAFVSREMHRQTCFSIYCYFVFTFALFGMQFCLETFVETDLFGIVISFCFVFFRQTDRQLDFLRLFQLDSQTDNYVFYKQHHRHVVTWLASLGAWPELDY